MTQPNNRKPQTGRAAHRKNNRSSGQNKPARQFHWRKIFSSAELVLVKKDLHAIWARRSVRALLIALPLFLVIVLPVAFFLLVTLLPKGGAVQPQQLLLQMELRQGELTNTALWATAFVNYICPMLYLVVPVICAVAAGSCAFVSEKENGTLDTLFLSSMRAKSVYNAKVTACTLITVLISWIAFFAFAITASVAEILLGAPFFFRLSWLVMVVLLTPALAFFSVVFVGLCCPTCPRWPSLCKQWAIFCCQSFCCIFCKFWELYKSPQCLFFSAQLCWLYWPSFCLIDRPRAFTLSISPG